MPFKFRPKRHRDPHRRGRHPALARGRGQLLSAAQRGAAEAQTQQVTLSTT